MSTQPNAISGAGSEPAEPIIANPELEISPTPESEPIEPETTLTEPETGLEPGGEPEPLSESTEDARRLPGYVRALKDSDPKAYAKAKTEFFDLNARRSVHPTVQAAREEHELIATSGGAEGISKLREDGQFFKSAAQQFLKGDPAFVKDLFEEDPIAAALHVPIMLDAYKERDKAGYQTTLAQLWDKEFTAVGLRERGLNPLKAAIQSGNKEEALSILDSIDNWQSSISDVARRAEDPRVKTLLAERAKQHETREQSEKTEFLKTYRTEAVNAVVEDGAKVFDSHFKGRKVSPEDRTDLLREAFALANRQVEADEDFKKQRDDHLGRGDSAAAMKLTRARFGKVLPEAVKRIARRYGMFSGQPRTAPNSGSQPTGSQPAGGTTAQGFTKINALPAPEDIDRAKSSRDMLRTGRAILKNGRKVDWAHLREKVA